MQQQLSRSQHQSAYQPTYQDHSAASPSSAEGALYRNSQSEHEEHHQAGLLAVQREHIDERITTARSLWANGKRIQALSILEGEARTYPEDAALDTAFREHLSAAIKGTDQAVCDHALTILQRSTKPWATAMLEAYREKHRPQIRRSSESIEDEMGRYQHLVEPAQFSPRPIAGRRPLPPAGPRLPQQQSPPSVAAADNRATAPSPSPARPVQEPLREARSPRTMPARPSATPKPELAPVTVQRRAAWAEVLSAMLVAFGAGAVIGVLTMALLGTSDVLSAGIFLGGLSAVLGVIGAGAILSVVFGSDRGFDFHEQGTQVLTLLLGAVLGCLMTLLVALLSAATGHSVTAWMTQALPSENYATALWMVWGMVGGLVWSGLFLREARRTQQA